MCGLKQPSLPSNKTLHHHRCHPPLHMEVEYFYGDLKDWRKNHCLSNLIQHYKITGNPRRRFLIKKLQWILLSILDAESKRVMYWWRKEYLMLYGRNFSRH